MKIYIGFQGFSIVANSKLLLDNFNGNLSNVVQN